MPATLPETAILISDLVTMWPDVVPPLVDQGEADRINTLLGNILGKLKDKGKSVPPMIWVSDSPPKDSRAASLDGSTQIDPVWFRLAYDNWAHTELFRAFWATLSEDDRRKFFKQVPK